MDTLSFAKKTAVRLPFRFKPRLAASWSVGIMMALSLIPVRAQSLYESMRNANNQGLSGYVFVSIHQPDATLIALARDARKAGMVMVLNGYFNDGPEGMDKTRRRIGEINSACCDKNGASWQINPLLYSRYKIDAVPSFVIALGASAASNDYSKISGEMGLATALKFFAQKSQISAIKTKASEVYTRAFSTQ